MVNRRATTLCVKKKHVHRHKGGHKSHPTFPYISMWAFHGQNRNRRSRAPTSPARHNICTYIHNVCPRMRQGQGSWGNLIGMCFNRSPYCPSSFTVLPHGWGKTGKLHDLFNFLHSFGNRRHIFLGSPYCPTFPYIFHYALLLDQLWHSSKRTVCIPTFQKVITI